MSNVEDHIERSIDVVATLSDVFNLWSNFENFPLFMPRLKTVRKMGESTSHWVMEGPLGAELEWDAETTALVPHERIAWRSLPHSDVQTSGEVTFFEVGPNETRVTVRMAYAVTGGPVMEAAAAVLSNPEGMVQESLDRFKRHVEHTGERLHEGDPKAKAVDENQRSGDLDPSRE